VTTVDREGAAASGGADDGGGGGGGGSAALVCVCGGSTAVVDVVVSVGVTTADSRVVVVRMEEVAAVRARERVHRLPLTVVIDSCGEAMQAIGSIKETLARLKREDGEKENQAPRAL
jgi:hypothetical protein